MLSDENSCKMRCLLLGATTVHPVFVTDMHAVISSTADLALGNASVIAVTVHSLMRCRSSTSVRCAALPTCARLMRINFKLASRFRRLCKVT